MSRHVQPYLSVGNSPARIRAPFNRRTRVAALALLALVAAGCGDDGGDSTSTNSNSDGEASEAKETPTPSPTPTTMIRGEYEAQPGQADDVQSTLEAAGFECSKHAEELVDLRACSKGMATEGGEYEDPNVTEANVRYASDPEGTVVFARIGTLGAGGPELDELLSQVHGALLPPEDAAIVEADGDTLSGGRYFSADDRSYYIVNGTDPSSVVPGTLPFSELTKEDAFAKLQESPNLDCSFGAPMDISEESKEDTLTCYDTTFESDNEDGSIMGATSTMVLTENLDASSVGLKTVRLSGEHASIPDDLRAVETLVPQLLDLTDEETSVAIADWIGAHLDGLPHTAYVGGYLTQIKVVPQSGLGDSVSAEAGPEIPALGLPAAEGGIDPPTAEW